MRKALLTLVLLMSVPAMGGISSLDPSSFRANSGEHFININGTGLGGTVTFSGPAGNITLEINAVTPSGVVAWVPLEVISTPGNYSLVVHGGNGGDAGPASFTVSGDVIKPRLTLILPEKLVVMATGRTGAVIEYEVSADGAGDPNPVISCDPKSGSLFPVGASRIKCTATNSFGGKTEDEIAVYVLDGSRPTLNLPKRVAVPMESEHGSYVKFDVSATDDVDGSVAVECAPKSGSLFALGETSVNCVATDSSLNVAEGTFVVEVLEKSSALKLDAPKGVFAEADSAEGALVVFEVRALGSLDPNPEVRCDPASESTFALGLTTVNCVASDKFGGRAEAKFDVQVADTTPPSLTLERAIAESLDGDDIKVWFKTSATDVVDGKADVYCKPESGSAFALGETHVDCTATDRSGNVGKGSTVITVADTIPPVIDGFSVSPERIEKANGEMVPVQIEVKAFDAVDRMPRCYVADVRASEDIDDDWSVDRDLDLQLRAETNGREDRRYEIYINCSDDFGNSATVNASVTVTAGSILTRTRDQ